MAMSQSTIDIVKKTAPAVAPHAKTIVTNFYKKMLGSHPELFQFFNKSHQSSGRQASALTDAVLAYATNIDNLGVLGPAVGIMATKHCALQVQPEHYQIVHDNLMASIAEVLGPDVATAEVAGGWSEAVMFLAQILIDAEAELYTAAAERQGGWRGWRDFVLDSKTEHGKDIATFTFKAADGYTGGFDFTPGQYMSLNLHMKDAEGDAISPRHYTITSSPGDSTLSCTVKRIPGGVVSNALHDMPLGTTVGMSPPFGVFTAPEAAEKTVLLSAGVGVTPMYAFQKQLGDKVTHAVHVDNKAEDNPFHQYFSDSCPSYSVVETGDGMADIPAVVAAMAEATPLQGADVLLCGPADFMHVANEELTKAGAKVSYENFGPRSK